MPLKPKINPQIKTYTKELIAEPDNLVSVKKAGDKLVFGLDTSTAAEKQAIIFEGGTAAWRTIPHPIVPPPEVPQSFSLVYNEEGAIERVVYANGDETVLQYDTEGNISEVNTASSTKILLYDTNGNLIGVQVILA
jgi:YD repeat-containing protein